MNVTPDIWKMSANVPVLARPERQARAARATPPSLTRLKSALDNIPNSGSGELPYDKWFAIICAIDHTTEHSDDGYQLALDFSSRASKFDEDFFSSRVWPYLRSDREGPVITENTIFMAAYGNNWIDPTLADGFEIIPETAEELAAKAVAKAKRDPYQIFEESEFSSGPPMQWIVKGVLPQADIGMVYGASGSGKSFFVLDLSGSIARGIPWRGRRVKQGRVLYVCAEGAGGFKSRLKAYKLAHEIETLDLAVMPASPNLNDPKVVKAVIKNALARGPFSLIVFDTLARVSTGAEENSAKEMGVILDHCREIGAATGAMLLLVHHSGKNISLGARGSTAVKANLDVEVEVLRLDKDRTATVRKMKDGVDDLTFGYRLKIVAVGVDDDGDPISSCVVEPTDVVVKDKLALEPQAVNQKLAYEAVREGVGLDGELPSREDVYAAACPLMASGAPDKRKQGMVRALNAIIKSGHVVETSHGLMVPVR